MRIHVFGGVVVCEIWVNLIWRCFGVGVVFVVVLGCGSGSNIVLLEEVRQVLVRGAGDRYGFLIGGGYLKVLGEGGGGCRGRC